MLRIRVSEEESEGLKLHRFVIDHKWQIYLVLIFKNSVLVGIFMKCLVLGQKSNSYFTVVPKDRNRTCLQ